MFPKKSLKLKKLTAQNLTDNEEKKVKAGGTWQTVCVQTCVPIVEGGGCSPGDTAPYPGGMCM